MNLFKLEPYTSTLFEQSWYLDIVAKDKWARKLIYKGEEVIGSFTYCYTRKFGFKSIKMPQLTQHLGPWVKKNNKLSNYKMLSRTDKVIQDALGSLPQFSFFSMRFAPSLVMLQQFYWEGFLNEHSYSYVLDDLSNEKMLLKGMESKVRTVINNNQKTKAIQIKKGLDAEKFYDLITSTFQRQNMKNRFSKEMVIELIENCRNRNCGEIIYAEDLSGNIHSAAFIVWDEFSSYYLLSGSDNKYRQSNSLTLVLWESIKFSSQYVDRFDFEGSMIEPIAKYVRGFGSKAIPYFHASKFNNKLLELVYNVNKVLRK